MITRSTPANRRPRLNFLVTLAIAIAAAAGPTASAQLGNDNPTGPSGQFNGNVTTGCSYDPYTGNATRAVTDMVVAGSVGTYPLAFARVSNSRWNTGQQNQFGDPGSWRHSYAWDIDSSEESTNLNFQPSYYPVEFPDGRTETFFANGADPYFRATPGIRERFIPLNQSTMLAYLVLPDGGKVEFRASRYSYVLGDGGGGSTPPPTGPTSVNRAETDISPNLGEPPPGDGPRYYGYHYKAQAIIDPYGLRTTLTYNGDGTLSVIQEPGGRWIQLVYTLTPWINPSTGYYDRVIDHLQASDGRTVRYNYGQTSYWPGNLAYTYLGNVVYYPDPSIASPPTAYYSYQNPNTGDPNGVPLLAAADDPMYAGPMRRISYTYATGTNGDGSPVVVGQIGSENSGTTGQPVSTAGAPTTTWRSETRGDGPYSRTFMYVGYGYGPMLQTSTDFNQIGAHQNRDGNGFINQLTDRNGHNTWIENDSLAGNAVRTTYPSTPGDTPPGTPAGFVVNTYGSWNCPDPNNRDGNNPYYLYSSQDEAGNVTVYWRDSNKRVIQINYPDGGTETFAYNGFGQVTSHQLKTGGVETFAYDPGTHLLTSYRDPYHDPVGQTGNPTAWFQYDPLGRVSSVTDAQGSGPGDPWHTTSYEYNLRGQITTTTLPIDPNDYYRHVIVNSYNPNNDGTLVSVTDPLGHVTSYGYDDYRRLRSLTTPGNDTPQTAWYFYDASGSGDDYTHTDSNVHLLRLPTGRKTVTVYDANSRKSAETVSGADGADSATTTYTYDYAGNLKTVKNPKQQPGQAYSGSTAATYEYDERNRVASVTDAFPHVTQFKYDHGGRKLSEERPNGQIITYNDYDPMNRPLTQTVTQVPTLDAVTNYTWWPSGQLHTVQDPRGKTYIYSYDLIGRKLSTVYPADSANATRSETYAYNALTGHPQAYTNRAGNVQTFYFDNFNRPTGFDWNDGFTPQQRTTYDAASRITQIWNWDATITNTYFNDGSLKTQTEVTGDWGDNTPRTVTYAYNPDGLRSNIIYPSGRSYSYGYYGRNDLWWILDNATGIYRTAYIYDVNSNVTTRYVGNWWVVTDLSQRDVLDRPTHVEHRFASGTRTMDYQYNEMSNVTWLQRDGGVPDTYGYDRASQLTSSTLNGTASNFGYDANGNRTSMNGGGFFSPNNLNEYDWFNNQATSYDANGNLASYNGSTYVYDAQNRLRSAINGSGQVNYYYDGLNRQITKGVWNGSSWDMTFNVWDGWNLIEERGLGNGLRNAYLYGREGILENLTTERFYYQDATGNTSHLSDRYGNLLESYRYTAFGQPSFYDGSGTALTASNYDSRHLFQGELWTPQTGLNDHRNRQALPSMGVFLQPDPIGFKGDPANLYRYCRNNSVNARDPMGTTVNFRGNVGAINTAINYLGGSPTFAAIFTALQNSPNVYTITTNYSFQNGSFTPTGNGGGVIVWNPSLALWVTSAEGIQSAAMILAHELAGHAQDYDVDPDSYDANSNTPAGVYDDMEEFAAVQTETQIANELREATRQDHRGEFQNTSDPTASVQFSASYTRYYLLGTIMFGQGWGHGSGLNEGSLGGASTATVAATIVQTLFGIPGGGPLPGEGTHPVTWDLN
ncbi:MAG: hypothetical protein QOH01_779 [Verrucomicrobiota bacterium]|jgi:RHS repeat-associated protein